MYSPIHLPRYIYPGVSCLSLIPQPVPYPFFADRFDKVLDMRLCEVLIIVLDQLRVDSWHGHEHINQRRLGAQQHVPHLGKRDKERWIRTTYN